jgi:predicted RNA-binding Zn-ribbon protein involved in translation (DUF1610 family)
MSKTILLDCPKCGRKIGIPGASGTVHVTCPSCGEQWDWAKRRAPALGAKWQAARASSGPFLEKAVFWFGRALFPPRFSGIQVIVALVGGIGIGVMVGDKLAIRRMDSEPDPINVSLPESPGTNYQRSVNSLEMQGVGQKNDEPFPTNFPNPEPPKPKR